MSDDEARPRHRKPGRARKRGSGTGRHLRAVESAPTAPPDSGAVAVPVPEAVPAAPPEALPETEALAEAQAEFEDGPVPPGAYPVGDLAALSPATVSMLRERAEAEAAAGITPIPHTLVVQDRGTGAVELHGPFPTGLEALAVGARLIAERDGAGTPVSIAVTPAYRP